MEPIISLIAGNGSAGFSGDGGLAIHSQLNSPYGIAIHPISGDIYIADYSNHKIRKISSSSGIISTIAGSGSGGFSGDGGLAINSNLNSPYGIAIHPINGDIYISEARNHRIRKISSSNGIISTIAGNGIRGFSGDGGLAIHSQLYIPIGITIHPINGDIYIADFGNQRIRKISSSGKISTIAGNGSAGYSGDGGLAINSQLNNPIGIAIHPHSGDIYIADQNNHRIRKISSSTRNISTIAGNGSAGYSGDGGLAIHSQLYNPFGIAIHPNSGDIYIADYGSHKIRKISSSGIISTIAGNGTGGYSGDGGLAINSQLYNPFGISIHPISGDIYISDQYNHRIRKINSFTITSPVKKYDRDIIKGTNITCCKYVINIYCPNMFKLLFNEQYEFINQLNSNQHEIIQHLIDSIIYTDITYNNYWFEKYDMVDVLFILGMIIRENDNELPILILTRHLVNEFMKSFNDETCPEILEKTMNLKDQFSTILIFKNSLLDQMINYSLEQASELIKKSSKFVEIPIISKQLFQIVPKLSILNKSIITIKGDNIDKSRTSKLNLESLFNNSTSSSDIIIKIGNNEYYCHKTILSSKSNYYEALFNSGCEYQDLKDNIHTIDTNEFDEHSQEIILKYCYGIFDTQLISPLQIIPLFKCAQFHDMKELSDYCVNNITITIENYCNLIEQLGTDHDRFCEKLIQFGIDHSTQVLGNREIL